MVAAVVVRVSMVMTTIAFLEELAAVEAMEEMEHQILEVEVVLSKMEDSVVQVVQAL